MCQSFSVFYFKCLHNCISNLSINCLPLYLRTGWSTSNFANCKNGLEKQVLRKNLKSCFWFLTIIYDYTVKCLKLRVFFFLNVKEQIHYNCVLLKNTEIVSVCMLSWHI